MSVWRFADKTVAFVSETTVVPPHVIAAVFEYTTAAEPECGLDATEAFDRLMRAVASWHSGEMMKLVGYLAEAEELRVMQDVSERKTGWTYIRLSLKSEKGGIR